MCSPTFLSQSLTDTYKGSLTGKSSSGSRNHVAPAGDRPRPDLLLQRPSLLLPSPPPSSALAAGPSPGDAGGGGPLAIPLQALLWRGTERAGGCP